MCQVTVAGRYRSDLSTDSLVEIADEYGQWINRRTDDLRVACLTGVQNIEQLAACRQVAERLNICLSSAEQKKKRCVTIVIVRQVEFGPLLSTQLESFAQAIQSFKDTQARTIEQIFIVVYNDPESEELLERLFNPPH